MIEYLNNIEPIVPLMKEWEKIAAGNDCNYEVSFETVYEDLRATLQAIEGTILASSRDGEYTGFMVLLKMPSILGKQSIGVEKYWYGKRDGVALFKEAEKWCRENGCSHLVMCASRLASELHDKVCRFYEKMGMRLYESTYIMEVK